jgi:hypothetical protein
MADYNNKGGLWKSTVNHYGKLTINGVGYEAKLWKLEGGNGLLVLTAPEGTKADRQHDGAQILLFKPDKEGVQAILSGRVGTKEKPLGYINVYKNDSGNERAPALSLTFKPVGAPTDNGRSTRQTDHF